MKRLAVRSGVVLLCGAVLLSCTTSPTGRRQLMMSSNDSLAPQAAQSFEEMKKKEKVTTNKALNDYAHCIVDPLLKEATLRYEHLPQSWEVVVFESATVNAFAMPGGKIGVYTGLMELTENADQLAAVLGHEIGHVVAQHSAERMSVAQATIVGLAVAGFATADNNNQRAIMAALGLGAAVGVQLPFSRTHESEADTIGQELMARSGFDPAQAVRLWELMGASSEGRPLEMLSTHPDPAKRAERLQADLTRMTPLYQQAQSLGMKPSCKKPPIPKVVAPKPVKKGEKPAAQ